MARAFRTFRVALVSALFVAGCAAPQRGEPRAIDASAAPAVPAALNVGKLRHDPCGLLSPAQLRTIGMPTPTSNRHESPVQLGCDWNDATVGLGGVRASVLLDTTLTGGLGDIYRQRHQMTHWEPVTATGYPGVLDDRSSDSCRMDLGVTDMDVVRLTYDGDAGSQPCDKVRALADVVVQSLKGTT